MAGANNRLAEEKNGSVVTGLYPVVCHPWKILRHVPGSAGHLRPGLTVA